MHGHSRAGGEEQHRHGIALDQVQRVERPVPQVRGERHARTHFCQRRIGQEEAVVDDAEREPSQQWSEAHEDGRDAQSRALRDAEPDHRRGEEGDGVEAVGRGQAGEQGERAPGRRLGAAPRQQARHEQREQQVGEGVLEARGRVAAQRGGEQPRQEHGEADHPGPGGVWAREHQERTERAEQAEHRHGPEDLAAEQVSAGVDQHPQRMGVDLHPLVHVPAQAVAVRQVLEDAIGDERVLADPGAGRRDRDEDRGEGEDRLPKRAQRQSPPPRIGYGSQS